jgi:hypothetical protein
MLGPAAASGCSTHGAVPECRASCTWLRAILMRALIVTGLVVLLLWFSAPAASGRSAVAPAPLACCAAGIPAAMTTAPIAAAVAAPAPPPPVVLQTIVDVPLPGSASRFDYQSLDEASGRLVIAHMGADQVVIVDTATR